WQIALLVGIGLGALAWLFAHERQAPEPMLPLDLWRRPVLALCNFAAFGSSATYMAVSALLPVYVQGVMGRSPSLAGFAVGAASVSWMFASIVAARIMIRTTYRLTATIGGLCLVAGSIILTWLDPDASMLLVVVGSFVLG